MPYYNPGRGRSHASASANVSHCPYYVQCWIILGHYSWIPSSYCYYVDTVTTLKTHQRIGMNLGQLLWTVGTRSNSLWCLWLASPQQILSKSSLMAYSSFLLQNHEALKGSVAEIASDVCYIFPHHAQNSFTLCIAVENWQDCCHHPGQHFEFSVASGSLLAGQSLPMLISPFLSPIGYLCLQWCIG